MANLNESEIRERTGNQGLNCVFNPPLAPHFGEAHQIMIKAAKKADEELMTALIGAESLINSRPITYLTANPNDDTPKQLTISHAANWVAILRPIT